MILKNILVIGSLVVAGTAFAKLKDATEVVKCQYHHNNWLGTETHVSSAKVMVDDRHIYIVSENSGKVIRRMRVGSKRFSEQGLTTEYAGFFLNPLLPITFWYGGIGGMKYLNYKSETSELVYSSYLALAGEQTFETRNVCDQIEGDEAQLAKLFPHKLRKNKQYEVRTINSKIFNDMKIEFYEKPEKVSDSSTYFSTNCQVRVDQEDETYRGGDAIAVQNWTLYTGSNEKVSDLIGMCKSLAQRFERDYINSLDIPPDHVSTTLKLFNEYPHGTPTRVGKVETIEGLKVISYPIADQYESENEWLCQMKYKQSDLSPGGSSYADIKWMVSGNQVGAIEACNNLLRRYRTNYIGKLENPIINEKTILTQIVEEENSQE